MADGLPIIFVEPTDIEQRPQMSVDFFFALSEIFFYGDGGQVGIVKPAISQTLKQLFVGDGLPRILASFCEQLDGHRVTIDLANQLQNDFFIIGVDGRNRREQLHGV